MHQENNIVIRIYQTSILLRECLEYTLDKHQIKKDLHQKRGEFFQKAIEGDFIAKLLSSNPEVASKVQSQLDTFYQEVFVENKYFLYDNDESFKTDEATRIHLFESIIGLYQTLSDMNISLMKQLKEKEILSPLVESLIHQEENLYTSRAGLVLFSDIVRQSSELNKLLAKLNQEKEGKAQAQFLLNDLRKTSGFVKFVKEKYLQGKEEILEMFTLLDETLKKMDGTNKVANEEVVIAIKATLGYASALGQVYDHLVKITYRSVIAELREHETEIQA